jgi:hypothetical protein
MAQTPQANPGTSGIRRDRVVMARAALAALILCGVVSKPMEASVVREYLHPGFLTYRGSTYGTDPISRFQIDRIISVAKFGLSFDAETVVIVDGTPNIQVQPALVSQIPVIVADVDNRATLRHNPSWRERIVSLNFVGIDTEGLEPVVLAGNPIDNPLDVLRRQVASVADIDVGMAFVWSARCAYSGRLNADIGPLENAGIGGLRLYASISDNPKPDGRDSQHAGKRDQPKGEIRRRVAASLR